MAKRDESGDIDSLLEETLNALKESLNLTEANFTTNYTLDKETDILTAILEFKNETEAAKFSEATNDYIDKLYYLIL